MPPKLLSPDAIKAIQAESLNRSVRFERTAVNETERTVEVAFSSEQPVKRYVWGDEFYEVLSHDPDAVDLSRFNNAGAVLKDHNWSQQIGVIEEAWIDPKDKKGRARIRFANSPLGQQEFQDVVDGIRQHISVGYSPKAMEKTREAEGEAPTYTVTKWEPLELSLVAVPADTSVGVGRSANQPYPQAARTDDLATPPVDAPPDVQPPTPETEAPPATEPAPPELLPSDPVTPITNDPERKYPAMPQELTAQQERERIKEITAIGQQFNLGDAEVARAIDESYSIDQVRKMALDNIRTTQPSSQTPIKLELGMNDKEIRQYSLMRAIRAAAENNWSQAGFEREMSQAAAKNLGISPRGFLIPFDVLARDLTSGTSSPGGGNLIGTTLMPESFIELLRNKMVAKKLGAFVMDGLTSNVDIPVQTGGSTATWVSEQSAGTESEATFSQRPLRPKYVTTFTELSRRFLNQSTPSGEQLVKNDLATALALAVDAAVLNGSGSSGQPRGILNTSGIGAVVGGTDGAVPTYSHIVDLETQIGAANGEVETMAYVVNPLIRGRLKKTAEFSNTATPIWKDNMMNGYRAMATNQVPKNQSKGSATTCSPIIFGNFADIIIGYWSALDLLVNPYSKDTQGDVRITAFLDCDILVRRPESFAAMADALPA